MATPDDLEEFRSRQIGMNGRAAKWNDLCRGAKHWINGPDEAQAIGLDPLMSGVKTEDEGLFVVQHSYWREAMEKAVADELSTPYASPANLTWLRYCSAGLP